MSEIEKIKRTGIRNISDLNIWIKYVRDHTFKNGQIWWRGQKNKNWELVPGIFRQKEDEKGEKYEPGIIQRFLLYASSRHDLPLPIDKPTQIYPIMQHYHLPTRLLDWTESPFIACYFAVEDIVLAKNEEKGEENDDEMTQGIIYAFSPRKYEEYTRDSRTNINLEIKNIYSMDDDEIKKIIDQAYQGIKSPEPIFYPVRPAQYNLRMLLQMTAFTIHGEGTPMTKYNGNKKYCVSIRIAGGKSKYANGKRILSPKKLLKEELKLYGIRRYNVYPDLDNLCNELRYDTKIDTLY